LLTEEQREIIYSTIPVDLAGTRWEKVKSYQISKEPPLPRLIISELTSGIREHYFADQLHKIIYEDAPVDVTYGQIDRATFSIVLEGYDRAVVDRAAAELQRWLLIEDYYEIWATQRVFFKGVIAAGEIPSLYSDRTGKIIYRCNVDFAINYEVSWPEDADKLDKYVMRIHKDERAQIVLQGEVEESK